MTVQYFLQRCNGEQDCPKNDDEHHCTVCEPDEFACDNAKCIDRSWVCDRVDDCGDNSDEINCDYSVNKKFDNTTISKPVDCEEFTCKIGGCLEFEKVCDGKQDCFDGSDEDGECCKQNTCSSFSRVSHSIFFYPAQKTRLLRLQIR